MQSYSFVLVGNRRLPTVTRIQTHVGVQLPMFLSPAEIVRETIQGNWGSVDLGATREINCESSDCDCFGYHEVPYYDGINDLWDQKLEESYDNGYVEDMPYWDVFDPIVIKIGPWYAIPTLGNGHHRIITGLEVNKSYIPVIWTARETHATLNTRDDNSN